MFYFFLGIFHSLLLVLLISNIRINEKQAGAELGQAQLKLGLDFNSINFNQTSIIVLVE